MKKEKSCGVIVFDKDNVLMVQHNKGHYGFPKGHVEENETEEETAIREVKEETSCDVLILNGFREVITYSPKENVMKDVVFFVGIPKTKNIKPQEEEVKEVKFYSIDEALKRVTYNEEKKILISAIDFYKGKVK
jgi:8-oxo-dGTP pyrophosphatase MutT (NUDIX family)